MLLNSKVDKPRDLPTLVELTTYEDVLSKIIIMPEDRSKRSASFVKVKDSQFEIVNGQHTLAACLRYMNDKSITKV